MPLRRTRRDLGAGGGEPLMNLHNDGKSFIHACRNFLFLGYEGLLWARAGAEV